MDLLWEARRLTDAPRLPPDTVQKLLANGGVSLDQLMLALIPAAQKYARPLVSGYRVGAVARGASGALYYGGNLEFNNIALNCTVHAEQAAVIHAATSAETAITNLAVSAPPCGYCRQFLYELVDAGRLQILLADRPPTLLTDYLPHPFGPPNLGIAGGLLSPQTRRLEWLNSPSEGQGLNEQVLEAARLSYAPYTGAVGAIGLVTKDGVTLLGPYFENAAFNPSISPVQAATVSLALANRAWDDVTTAICVQTSGSKIDHTSVARDVLSKTAPHVRLEELLIRATASQ